MFERTGRVWRRLRWFVKNSADRRTDKTTDGRH